MLAILRMPTRSARSTLLALVLASGCNRDDAQHAAGTVDEVNGQGWVGALELRVVGDAELEVTLATGAAAGKGVSAALRRGRGLAVHDCVLSGRSGAEAERLEQITCGPYEVTRSGSAYTLSISERLQKQSLGAEPVAPDDPILPLRLGETRSLTVARSTGVHPLEITLRVEEGLRELAGTPYRGGGQIRGVARWTALDDLTPQPTFTFGAGEPPYPTTEACYSSDRPSVFLDPRDRTKGLASADEFARRYRAWLAAPPTGRGAPCW